WTNSAGTSLALPMTIETAEIVDPVPVGGGIINGNTRLGFDSNNRVVIAYHKYDAQGNTQIYAARLEDGAWRIYQVSDWDYRWEFSGGGAIPFEVHVGGVSPHGEGQLTLSYGQPKTGSGVWILDENTMKPAGTLEKKPAYPRAIAGVESPLPGMQVQWTGDSGKSGEPGVRYVMRWETLGANRDRPREGELPGPSMLRLYKMRSQ
ncbi:MAG: hypothetical protein QG656_1141, partial [Candidatus Hydrogenedentes bacterium]|nr:hypothetical protein [Candidatus Hydrogenedentota bacterium]